MSSTGSPLMVIGHKNPDTDSICSAIAYAHYKREITGVSALQYRAGNLNLQPSFVLDHLGVTIRNWSPRCCPSSLTS